MTLSASVPASVVASVPYVGALATHPIPWLPADASWLSVVQGCVPVAIAAMVAWVGWRQLATAKAKLKLDLFEKRLAIFDKTWEALSKSSTGEFIQPNEMGPLHNLIPEAAFLFGRDIEAYIEMVKHRMADQQLRLLRIHQEGVYASQELMDKSAESRRWFAEECQAVKKKFSPYLSFHDWH